MVARSTPRARYGLFFFRKRKNKTKFKIAPSMMRLPKESLAIDAFIVSPNELTWFDKLLKIRTHSTNPIVLANTPNNKP